MMNEMMRPFKKSEELKKSLRNVNNDYKKKIFIIN